MVDAHGGEQKCPQIPAPSVSSLLRYWSSSLGSSSSTTSAAKRAGAMRCGRSTHFEPARLVDQQLTLDLVEPAEGDEQRAAAGHTGEGGRAAACGSDRATDVRFWIFVEPRTVRLPFAELANLPLVNFRRIGTSASANGCDAMRASSQSGSAPPFQASLVTPKAPGSLASRSATRCPTHWAWQ